MLHYTPILVDLLGNGTDMSGLQDGVTFQINSAGSQLKLGWPVGSDDVWLAFDRNGNGTIDHGGELFGNTTPQRTGGFAPNGYEALADLDENGDSWVDADDAQFDRILVWSDGNRNGVAEPSELRSAVDAGISGSARGIGNRDGKINGATSSNTSDGWRRSSASADPSTCIRRPSHVGVERVPTQPRNGQRHRTFYDLRFLLTNTQ